MLVERQERLLLIDTCGGNAGVALSEGTRVVAAIELPQGKASAEILGAVRLLLAEASWVLAELAAVGVVSGPGSFTGMRTGLAVAKGLCEAAGLRLVAVSRLAVLAEAAALADGFAVLDAGRGELYVRQVARGEVPLEFLCRGEDVEGVFAMHEARTIAAGDAKSIALLAPHGAVLRSPTVSDALPVVLRALAGVAVDAALVEANYVRLEQDIYPRRPVA